MGKRNWLIEKRKKSGKSQEKIAMAVNITQTYYSYIELGIRRPSPDVAMQIAKVLKFDWKKFYEREKNTDIEKKVTLSPKDISEQLDLFKKLN